MDLTCLCCGHKEHFEDALDAFNAGWDVAPYFQLEPLCDLCPTTLYAKRIEIDGQAYFRTLKPGELPEHDTVHQRWKTEGRPATFTIDTCT